MLRPNLVTQAGPLHAAFGAAPVTCILGCLRNSQAQRRGQHEHFIQPATRTGPPAWFPASCWRSRPPWWSRPPPGLRPAQPRSRRSSCRHPRSICKPPHPARLQSAVFAGGCFWGVQAVFQHTPGRARAPCRAMRAARPTAAHYETVGSGTTGHAEAVQVKWDPAGSATASCCRSSSRSRTTRPSSIAKDPTPARNTVRRSSSRMRRSRRWHSATSRNSMPRMHSRRKIVTQLAPLNGFYPRRGLSPGLCNAASGLALHRRVRPAQDRQPQVGVPDCTVTRRCSWDGPRCSRDCGTAPGRSASPGERRGQLPGLDAKSMAPAPAVAR